MTALRDAARSYMTRGWAVLLLSTDGSGGKVPSGNCPQCRPLADTYVWHLPKDCDHLLCHGFYAATSDPDRFDRMLEALPNGQLAIRTGRASRLLVIDAEAHSKKPDEPTGLEVLEQWQQFANVEWSPPPTLTSRSVSGGLHLYYRIPDNAEIGSGRILPNVDVKCESGYVGAPSGQTARVWLNADAEIADAPAELLEWLRVGKRLAAGGGPGGGGMGAPDGYDFKKFLTEGCPDGYRDFFFNDLCFRLRKNGTPRESYEEQIWQAWNAAAQPPDATWEMPWEHVQYKMERVWATIEPEIDQGNIAWAQQIIAAQWQATTKVAIGGGDDGGAPPAQLSIGELDHTRWYGPHDDGTAERMAAVWGDWFRAIPKLRAGHVWLRYDGVTWQLDAHERIWQAMKHVVELLPAEVAAWEARAIAEDAERGEDDPTNWLTERVGGGGAQANEFRAIVQLRKYVAECRNNARKEGGVKAFARLPGVAIAEEDLDALTRYVGLPDRRVLDVQAVHENRDRREWVVTARPDMLITKQLGCSYVPPREDVPGTLYEFSNFKRYLEVVLPDKSVRETLQEILGYALLGDPTEKLIVLLHGPPDSGKTVLLEVMEALFGSYGDWADSQALIAGKAKSAHSEWLHKLRGLRLIVTPETAKGAKIDAAWMKSYTGREPQTSRGAYGDRSVTWKPTGIIVNASNHYIEYDAEDTAVAERTQVIEFEEQFLRGDERRDDKLPQKIKEGELPIVLNWILEGLRRHGARAGAPGGARLVIAPKIVEWSRRYRTAQDHVGQFLVDALAEGRLEHVTCVKGMCEGEETCPAAGNDPLPDSAYVPAKVVLALYKSWCRAQEIKKPIGRNTFNSHLIRVYHWCSVESHGKRWFGFTSQITDDISAEIVRW